MRYDNVWLVELATFIFEAEDKEKDVPM